jgi:hypothetical protein
VGITGNISLTGGTLAVINGSLTLNGNAVGSSSSANPTFSGNISLSSSGNLIVTPLYAAAWGSASWTNNNITWTATASVIRTSNGPANFVYAPTNGNLYTIPSWSTPNGCYNGTGGYTGSTVTAVVDLGNISGEWVQIQSNVALIANNYYFTSTQGNGGNSPANYLIVGSTDNNTWYPISNCVSSSNLRTSSIYPNTGFLPTATFLVNYSGVQSSTGPGSLTTTKYSYTTNTYTYFRIIIMTIFSGSGYTWGGIANWGIYFSQPTTIQTTPIVTYNNNVLNSAMINGPLQINNYILPTYSSLNSFYPGQIGWSYATSGSVTLSTTSVFVGEATGRLPAGVYLWAGSITLYSFTTTCGLTYTLWGGTMTLSCITSLSSSMGSVLPLSGIMHTPEPYCSFIPRASLTSGTCTAGYSWQLTRIA